MAKVYLYYIQCIKEQDPRGGDNNDEIYYLVESSSKKNTVSNSFDAGEILFPNKLLENDPATKADPLFFTLWEDDPGSGPSFDDKFSSIRQFAGSDPGTIKDGGIFFDGTPGYFRFTFSGNGGQYELGFDVK
ncbi:MAG: hypothetical protein V7K90_11910 [Nostoc sp.]|uniref:hypothetical protein n=1 Tax=unclassified Nostoc TaxID=2593658 RepID=UPI000C0500E7|nr:hypothetical protein [Nostoc sp. 'Peltigera malacea cyanobiont' DB3992]PHM09010.1 hypothetical protein CK516_17190 [Nostoc sp. 'Peltigera malacea cyanobiont' DB3992]